jgi:VWFA-related protein
MLTGHQRRRLVQLFVLIATISSSSPIRSDIQVGRSRTDPVRTSNTQKTNTDPRPEPSPKPEPATSHDQQDLETLKIDTDLIMVPVIATDINGLYIPDLERKEFTVSEDGVNQEIAFFGTVSVPFHVVLMLDTSASTREKLTLIRQAAVAFVEQLQPADRVKIISFDDQVRDLNEFTNDRGALKAAIYRTQSGEGTKLYDAVQLALDSVKRIRGRKAIVLFSDGVDFHSSSASFDGTLRGLDEEGVLFYPIRYHTREETERIAREQSGRAPQLPTISVIRTPTPGTTPPTFPSEDPSSVPSPDIRNKTGPLGLPLPEEIMRRRSQTERDRELGRLPPDRLPPPEPRPTINDPNDPFPDRGNDPRTTRDRSPRRNDDSIDVMLDHLYLKADTYLKARAEKSGGRLLAADTLGSLPQAFAKIAAELRTQYSIGYYPTNKTRDEGYRRIKVSTTRKNVIIRARPGYRSLSRR